MHKVVGEERSLGTSCDGCPEGSHKWCDMGGDVGVGMEILWRTMSNQWEMWCNWESERVPYNCLEYVWGLRCGIQSKCNGSSGVCCDSCDGNGDRQPSSIHES